MDGKTFKIRGVKRIVTIFTINLLFVALLFVHPKSEIYHIWKLSNKEIIEHYTNNIGADTGTYVFRQKDDIRRTIGYPLILNFFLQFDQFIFYILLFNCLIGTWCFYVIHELIGKRVWILFVLGFPTAYVAHLYTDLLFATIFITAIWQLKKKKFWFSLVLISSAALIRPSLAWFFVVIPAVMYFYEYKPKMVLIALPLMFLATCFNPARNYVNHRQWVHAPIISEHIESETYIGGAESKLKYFAYAFKVNFLSDHYNYAGMMFNVYKRDNGDRKESDVMKLFQTIGVLANLIIWFLFVVKIVNKIRNGQNKLNWGDVIILLYFIVPTLFGAAGARLRLPVEWILLI